MRIYTLEQRKTYPNTSPRRKKKKKNLKRVSSSREEKRMVSIQKNHPKKEGPDSERQELSSSVELNVQLVHLFLTRLALEENSQLSHVEISFRSKLKFRLKQRQVSIPDFHELLVTDIFTSNLYSLFFSLPDILYTLNVSRTSNDNFEIS